MARREKAKNLKRYKLPDYLKSRTPHPMWAMLKARQAAGRPVKLTPLQLFHLAVRKEILPMLKEL